MKVKRIKKLFVMILLALLLINIPNFARLLYPAKYMDQIKKYATEYEVDPYLILSIIKAESNFKQNAVSHKNATGLMQIMEPTANWLAQKMKLSDFQYKNITEPELNIQIGCYYIAYLAEIYNGNVDNTLAAYNAGEGTVNNWLANKDYSTDGFSLSYIPYPETRRYITQVKNNQKIYRLLYKITP